MIKQLKKITWQQQLWLVLGQQIVPFVLATVIMIKDFIAQNPVIPFVKNYPAMFLAISLMFNFTRLFSEIFLFLGTVIMIIRNKTPRYSWLCLFIPMQGLLLWYWYDTMAPFGDAGDSEFYKEGFTLYNYITACVIECAITMLYWQPLRKSK